MSNLDLLLQATGGEILVTFEQASSILGFSPQALRNQHTRGNFPIRTVKLGGARRISVVDIAAYLDGTAPPVSDEKPPQLLKRRRGRPRKTAGEGNHG